MKIHYFVKSLLLIMILAGATPSLASSLHEPIIENREAEANRLKNRLEQIKAMDKSELTKADRKALRGEVRAIKKELAAVSGGVYLSIGAILLIALLIILLV